MVLEDVSTSGSDAACWFGARRLSQQGLPNAFVATLWTKKLGVERGLPAHQATSEAFMALMDVCHFVTPRTRERIGDARGVWVGLTRHDSACIHV